MDARKVFRHGLTFLLLFVAWLYPSHLFGASTNNASLTSRCLFTNASELSDFDGDNRLDRAKLFSNGRLKIVHITFGKPAWAHSLGSLFPGNAYHFDQYCQLRPILRGEGCAGTLGFRCAQDAE